MGKYHKLSKSYDYVVVNKVYKFVHVINVKVQIFSGRNDWRLSHYKIRCSNRMLNTFILPRLDNLFRMTLTNDFHR